MDSVKDKKVDEKETKHEAEKRFVAEFKANFEAEIYDKWMTEAEKYYTAENLDKFSKRIKSSVELNSSQYLLECVVDDVETSLKILENLKNENIEEAKNLYYKIHSLVSERMRSGKIPYLFNSKYIELLMPVIEEDVVAYYIETCEHTSEMMNYSDKTLDTLRRSIEENKQKKTVFEEKQSQPGA
jgi:hypothetical protein